MKELMTKIEHQRLETQRRCERMMDIGTIKIPHTVTNERKYKKDRQNRENRLREKLSCS